MNKIKTSCTDEQLSFIVKSVKYRFIERMLDITLDPKAEIYAEKWRELFGVKESGCGTNE